MLAEFIIDNIRQAYRSLGDRPLPRLREALVERCFINLNIQFFIALDNGQNFRFTIDERAVWPDLPDRINLHQLLHHCEMTVRADFISEEPLNLTATQVLDRHSRAALMYCTTGEGDYLPYVPYTHEDAAMRGGGNGGSAHNFTGEEIAWDSLGEVVLANGGAGYVGRNGGGGGAGCVGRNGGGGGAGNVTVGGSGGGAGRCVPYDRYTALCRDEELRNEKRFRTAEERARQLLMENLNPEQLAMYKETGKFEVIGCDTGRLYLITSASSYNVNEVKVCGGWFGAKRQRLIRKICFVPIGAPYQGDVMLAQKIALENYEYEALRVANFSDRYG